VHFLFLANSKLPVIARVFLWVLSPAWRRALTHGAVSEKMAELTEQLLHTSGKVKIFSISFARNLRLDCAPVLKVARENADRHGLSRRGMPCRAMHWKFRSGPAMTWCWC